MICLQGCLSILSPSPTINIQATFLVRNYQDLLCIVRGRGNQLSLPPGIQYTWKVCEIITWKFCGLKEAQSKMPTYLPASGLRRLRTSMWVLLCRWHSPARHSGPTQGKVCSQVNFLGMDFVPPPSYLDTLSAALVVT